MQRGYLQFWSVCRKVFVTLCFLQYFWVYDLFWPAFSLPTVVIEPVFTDLREVDGVGFPECEFFYIVSLCNILNCSPFFLHYPSSMRFGFVTTVLNAVPESCFPRDEGHAAAGKRNAKPWRAQKLTVIVVFILVLFRYGQITVICDSYRFCDSTRKSSMLPMII